MKKLMIAALLTIGLTSNAFAHHNSNSDNAGGNINDGSGHLELVFG